MQMQTYYFFFAVMAYGAPDNLPLSEEAYNCPGKPYRHSRLEAEKEICKMGKCSN